MSHRTRTARKTLVTGLVVGPLALALVACGGEDDTTTDASDTQETSSTAPETTEPSPETPSATATESAPETSAPAPSGDPDLMAAARTALGAVGGSTLFSIDLEASGWDVTVVTGNGTENDVDVALDGSAVTRGPVEDPDDADDNDDQAERQRLLGVGVDYRAAIQAATAEIPNGTVTGASLDEDNGSATWEIQFDEDTADETTIDVDAESGQVVGVEIDD